jgi:hypothetical protein
MGGHVDPHHTKIASQSNGQGSIIFFLFDDTQKKERHGCIHRRTYQAPTNQPTMSFLKSTGKAFGDIIPGLGRFTFDPTVGTIL